MEYSCFFLPFFNPEPAIIEAGQTRKEKVGIGMRKIAVIEDDRVLRQSLAGILKENGYEVCCVEDFAHAEEEVRKAEADLLLLDIYSAGKQMDRRFCGICGKLRNIPVPDAYPAKQGKRNEFMAYELRGGRLHDKTV